MLKNKTTSPAIWLLLRSYFLFDVAENASVFPISQCKYDKDISFVLNALMKKICNFIANGEPLLHWSIGIMVTYLVFQLCLVAISIAIVMSTSSHIADKQGLPLFNQLMSWTILGKGEFSLTYHYWLYDIKSFIHLPGMLSFLFQQWGWSNLCWFIYVYLWIT